MRSRGVAFAAALVGNGVTGIFAPPLIAYAIREQGWRHAYLACAAATVLIGLLPVVLLFKETASSRSRSFWAAGLTQRQALRGYRIWIVSVAFVLLSFGVTGAISSLVPLLLGHGLSAMLAAKYASIVGVSLVVGRLVAGYLLDRFWAPAVGSALLLIPIVSCVVLAQSALSRVEAALSIAGLGITAGMEFDLMGYYCARYFGLRAYGAIFAWPWTGFAIGAALGAAVFSRARDDSGGYGPVLLLAACTFAASALLMLMLGRYPQFESEDEAALSDRRS